MAILSGFALLDHTVVGLREAGWAATKNIVHSVAKLVALVAFAFTASRAGMVWTWLLLAAGCAVVLAVVVARRVGTEYRDGPVTLPPRREMRGFLAASYGIYVVGAIAPLVLPIVVIATLGAEANAYFAICWSLVSAVLVLMTMLTGPFVASVVSAPEAERAPAIRRETRRYVTILGAVAVAGVLGCAGIAPMLLGLLDPAYQEEGVPLLRIVAWAFPLAIVALVYNALARVTRRLRLAVGVQLLVAVVVLGGSALFLPEHGIRAIGWSYVVAEALAAVVLVVPLRRMLRSAAQPIGAASGAGSNSPSDSISRSSDSIGA
ncbi:lipopolysaccharide biosynthesis protein [Rhodococcus rhodnii]|uniref:Lipopolysaccharide biosynthesis protein n=1 Tax=Rhodococcus rhodnii TaxID=38312 RepID=A0A6P2CH06_9NOCA|nr:lipopolysaccharide biosynthesis protein [Rhodococcus rhodnii]